MQLNDTQGVPSPGLGSEVMAKWPRKNRENSLGRGQGLLGQEGMMGLPPVRNLANDKLERLRTIMKNKGHVTRM